MINIPIWTFWSLNALAIVVVIFLQKRNARLLSSDELKEKARIVSAETSLKRPQNWGFLAALTAADNFQPAF